MTAVKLTAAERRRREKKDALRAQRDQALREIGDSLADGHRTLEERAGRARAAVWEDFKRQMQHLTDGGAT